MTTTCEAITGLADVAEGMLAYSRQCNYISLDDTLANALGRPAKFTEKSNRSSHAPRSVEALAKVFMRKFRVDEAGAFKDKKAVFDAQGFLLTSYNHLARLIGYSRRQVIRCMAWLKKAGIVSVRQDVNEDGSYGPIWVRLNPWSLIKYAKATLKKVASKIGRRDSTSPCAKLGSLTSSVTPSQKSAPSVADSDPELKKDITPCEEGVIPVSTESKTPAEVEAFTRKTILETRTGDVVKTLTPVFPEVENAPVKQIDKLHRLATQGPPDLRLSPQMAERLVAVMERQPDLLEEFAHLDNEKNGFSVLLEYWPGIRNKLMRDRLSEHDMDTFNDRTFIQSIEAEIAEQPQPQDEASIKQRQIAEINRLKLLRAQDPQQFRARQLLIGLKLNLPKVFINTMARLARPYLVEHPAFYAILRRHFPQIVRLCGIPEYLDRQLLRRFTTRAAEIETWDRIKSNYGFEHDLTVFERRSFSKS